MSVTSCYSTSAALMFFVHELCVTDRCPELPITVNIKREYRDADQPALEAKVTLSAKKEVIIRLYC